MENSSTEFIDIHHSKEAFEKRIEKLKKDVIIIPENKELILKFIADARSGKTVKNRAKKKIGHSRCLKYAYALKRFSEWFDKPLDRVIAKDMEKVISNLEEDKYNIYSKNRKNKNYSEKTKLDFKKDIKKFFRWMHGDTERYHDLTSWIDTHEEIQEVPALTREEVEKMANACDTRNKAIIMILFDSGCRIEEFLNIRIGDLTKKEDNYYMIRIKHSKTKPRTISIPMCTQILEAWLTSHTNRDDSNAQLFPMTYDAVRVMLKRISKRVLKKDAYPHLFRHSSATYYCHKLNQYQLCYRYGWSMASKQPARYIDREGINEEETAELVKTDDVAKLRKEIQKTNENYASLKEDNANLHRLVERASLSARIFNRLEKEMPDLKEKAAEIANKMVAEGDIHIS